MYLLVYSLVVRLRLHIADDAEGNREKGGSIDFQISLLSHEGKETMECRILLVRVMNEHALIVSRHYNQPRNKGLRVDLYSQTFVFVLAEDHFLAMAENDAVLLSLFAIGDPRMRSVIENHTVNETFNNRRTFVLLRGYKAIDRRRHIDIERAGKERTTCAEHQLCRNKRTLYRSERRGFGDKSFRAGRRILTFGQTVDAVIEETDIEIDVSAYLVDEMVSSDSEAVAVAGHLPNGQFGMACLHAGSDRTATTLNGIETVGIEIVRHSAGTTNTGDDCHLVGRDSYLRHGFLKRHADSVVAATRAETYILIGFEL